MRIVRLVIMFSALAGGILAGASPAATPAPTALHGFLLRADEPRTATFHRTPSFAWSPVSGAAHYELQLSTSSTFRDNGILYDDRTLLTPVAAPTLTLPWITGSPHSLYARVRALFPGGGASPWSAEFGFDVVPPAVPTPMTAYPGILRWTPVDGADGYQVWLLDTGKIESVNTNVLDEREYYGFHNSQQWIGTVHWRVRALRDDSVGRRNGIPAATYGAWSPIYSAANPPPTDGQIQLTGTLSDVFSDGSPNSPAHELMPGFVWTGDEGLAGTPAQFFRVYVFTDAQCLNRVFTSAVVSSPAYAPRINGPLSLPVWTEDVAGAQASYLADGPETNDVTNDGEQVVPTEQQPGAAPTTTLPGGKKGLNVTGKPGAPVDLWDVDWPSSGYYWTVIPVEAFGDQYATVAAPGATAGSTVVPVDASQPFSVGDQVRIYNGQTIDAGTVIAVGGGTITLDTPLAHDHAPGDVISRKIRYQDLELPQDACAAGRVARFGISSEPSLTAGPEPYATGLSSKGRLVSAAGTRAFYGQPLVAWTPALGASVYEVQWSRTLYPFRAQVDSSTGAHGFLTAATSAVLPLRPGTWWYRVRGFDYNLPTGAQEMSWSDATKLVVTAPKFRLG